MDLILQNYMLITKIHIVILHTLTQQFDNIKLSSKSRMNSFPLKFSLLTDLFDKLLLKY